MVLRPERFCDGLLGVMARVATSRSSSVAVSAPSSLQHQQGSLGQRSRLRLWTDLGFLPPVDASPVFRAVQTSTFGRGGVQSWTEMRNGMDRLASEPIDHEVKATYESA